MSKRNVARLAGLVKQCGPEAILRAASLCDGHTIFVPKAFVDAGLPTEVVEHLTTSHASDGSPKGTIFVSGRAVQELRGVYGLDLLRFLALALGVDYPRALGRGTEAANIRDALRQHLVRPPSSPVA